MGFLDKLFGRKKKDSGDMKPAAHEPASMPQGGTTPAPPAPEEPKPMGGEQSSGGGGAS